MVRVRTSSRRVISGLTPIFIRHMTDIRMAGLGAEGTPTAVILMHTRMRLGFIN